MKCMTFLMIVLPALFVMSVPAGADPERAYQGGKKLAETVTGQKNDVDDRDAEARLNDWLRKKGEEHGKALQGKSKVESEKRTEKE